MLKHKSLWLIAGALFPASLACQQLFPKTIAPGSLEEQVAEGNAFLEGEGFEGEYACWGRDGGLIYEVAFSAYEMSK